MHWSTTILNFSIRNDSPYGEGRVFVNIRWEHLELSLLSKISTVVADLNQPWITTDSIIGFVSFSVLLNYSALISIQFISSNVHFTSIPLTPEGDFLCLKLNLNHFNWWGKIRCIQPSAIKVSFLKKMKIKIKWFCWLFKQESVKKDVVNENKIERNGWVN